MMLMVVFGVALLAAVPLSDLAARAALSTSLLFLVGGALAGEGSPGLIHITPDGGIASATADLAFFTQLSVTIGGSTLLPGASTVRSGAVADIPVTPLQVISTPRSAAMARWPSPPACSTAWAGRGPGVSLRHRSDVRF
ncbi:hypothetical protein [Streptomyces sparsogenes]|uniref:Sodium/hydrogen exchanger n=1 Tax=Streptomyces sparsogenes DSM 40356 TaxID=1331668 RepID=A0A1R1SAN4_9ACTN|nr:sodium/hydrogen exchanger [Streptomyces sparsogenes DSM 40356]